jgi:hypothetical protein
VRYITEIADKNSFHEGVSNYDGIVLRFHPDETTREFKLERIRQRRKRSGRQEMGNRRESSRLRSFAGSLSRDCEAADDVCGGRPGKGTIAAMKVGRRAMHGGERHVQALALMPGIVDAVAGPEQPTF